MAAHSHPAAPGHRAGPAGHVVVALRRIFRDRLRSVVAYGPQIEDGGRGASHAASSLSCLALVSNLTVSDLEACAALSHGWQREGVGTPLLLPEDEFR